MNIVLCGLPMCGKTTTGKLVAEKLQWDFIDTDALIEKAKGTRCQHIFLTEGEYAFRTIETTQIASVRHVEHTVIAIGGGTLTIQENWNMLKDMGICIYLKVAPELLWERTKLCGIPVYLKSKNAFYKMVQERILQYEAYANYTIETSYMPVQEVVEALIHKIRYGK